MAINPVLASNVYNPSREPEVLELYTLMNSEEPSETLLDQYKEMVNSLGSSNPYKGVLVNPRSCEVDQATTDLDEIIDEVRDNPEVPPWIPDTLEDAKDVLEQYKEHTDRLIANFPTISSIVQNEIANSVSQLQSENPCLAFGDIMGSILQAGQDIMNEILATIANVKDNTDNIETLADEVVNKLMAKIAKAKTQLEEEVEKIAKAMLEMEKMNLAQMMKYQTQDPCLKHILSGVLTGAAKNVIGETS